ncbi:MAG: hypothetical protein A3E01_08965 [Gammaproteobacteria bacterium RIFCSPHIGHO2_12_FULL_63_22]|nr:MAG: hypothetical protein A3E01_08965 [Gammaproteobacteria bacterium RIFCSPHIGHO2_12_FULL_63_22]
MSRQDLGMVLTWRNDESVRMNMFSSAPIGVEEHRQWFEQTEAEPGRHLLIFEVMGVPVGFVNLAPCDSAGTSRWGFYTAPGAPKGTGRLLGETALHYAFDLAGIERICGEVVLSNQASIRFHLGLGFHQLDQHAIRSLGDGQTAEIVQFWLTKEDFRKARE